MSLNRISSSLLKSLQHDNSRASSLAVVATGTALLLATPAVRAGDAAAPVVDLAKSVEIDGVLQVPLKSGDQATLTLEPRLQKSARRLLARANPVRGAIVLADVRNGNVLVHAGFVRGKGASAASPQAMSAPSASVFKLITSAALIERSKVPVSKRVCYLDAAHGIYRRHLDPPKSGRAACSTFRDALGHSRNAVYAQLTTKYLARQELIDTASAFGFNTTVPFNGPTKVGTATVPVDDLQFARMSAGFRDSSLTPLGGAHIAAMLAGGGQARELRIVKGTSTYTAAKRSAKLPRAVKGSTAWTLRKMMETTVHGGTALDAFTKPKGGRYLTGIRIASKTGTLKRDANTTTTWFIGFAPARSPKIAWAVTLDNSRVWRKKAKHVGRDVLRAYYHQRGRAGVDDPIRNP